MNSRLQFKARFRRHFDVREILAEDKFVDNIVEHMWMAWQASREALATENAELVKDRERIDLLNTLGYAYGFQDMHEGNRWEIEGPFIDVRDTLRKQLDEARSLLLMVGEANGFLEPHQMDCIDEWMEANKK